MTNGYPPEYPGIPATTLNCRGRLLDISRPVVMGILNVTPDSFFDGGRYAGRDAALRQAEKMLAEGAAILDVGGASSRPGAVEVSAEEEMARIVPVIAAIRQHFPDAFISVDTWRPEVAAAALEAGASILNDISAGLFGSVALGAAPPIPPGGGEDVSRPAFTKSTGATLPGAPGGEEDVSRPAFTKSPGATLPGTPGGGEDVSRPAFTERPGTTLPVPPGGEEDVSSPAFTERPGATLPGAPGGEESVSSPAFTERPGATLPSPPPGGPGGALPGAPYILMHMQGSPATMQQNPQYEDVVTEVLDFFIREVKKLRELGVRDIVLDPGFGFGKTVEHNYQLLKNLPVFRNVLGLPVLAGLSRKSMICKVLKVNPEHALNGTTALHMIALQQGAGILRAHDVREAVQVIRLWEQLEQA